MKNKQLYRVLSVLLCALLLSLAVTSCSANGKALDRAEWPQEAPQEPDEYGYKSSILYSKALSSSDGKDAGDDKETTEPAYEQKIIRNVTISAETKDYDRTVNEIGKALKELGGYEESVSTNGRSYRSNTYVRTANMTLRVPSEKLDEFLGTVGELVNIVSQKGGVENATEQYYDIVSRISVLEDEKAAYEEMLRKADDVNVMLEIERRLYDVIEEIEAYETKLRVIDSKVAYSTVSLYLEEVVDYSEVNTTEDSFGTRIGKAFKESWKSFGKGFLTFLVGLTYALPTLLLLAAIAGVIVLIVIRCTRKKKNGSTPPPQNK